MSSLWNNRISISLFGESHGTAIGVVIDNLPPGESIDLEEIARFLARRAPKKDGTTTSRAELDIPQIMSGLHNNKTTGTPLCAMIMNTDTHSADYSNLSKLARPGHADYTGALRYRGFNDVRGGGHFSGRLLPCALQVLSAARFWSVGASIPVPTLPPFTAFRMTPLTGPMSPRRSCWRYAIRASRSSTPNREKKCGRISRRHGWGRNPWGASSNAPA